MDDLFGKHSMFYYYCEEHLFINLVNYIAKGINNKEKIYISIEKSLCEKLMDILVVNNISTESIRFVNVKDLMLGSQINGVLEVKKLINKYEKEEVNKGFSGIRYIWQPSHVIRETSKEVFLDFECRLTYALKGTSSSLLCVYDFHDYINEKDIIDEDIIQESTNTHTYVLEKFLIKDRVYK